MSNVITVKNLVKSFGGKTVVDSISFSVEKRSLFAFLGQNGAGKTTTINMIIGLIGKDSGEIHYGGSQNFSEYKNKIGVVFQNNILEDMLTVEENLLFFGTMYLNSTRKAKKRMNEVAELLSLQKVLKQRFKTLSGGQKRKAEIARALFMSPEILFLDEPTTGLDPRTRAEVWGIINKLRADIGMTIFLTTHYMEETAWADNIAIIDKGKIIATGSPNELKSKHTSDRLFITPVDNGLFEKQMEKLSLCVKKTADTYVIEVSDAKTSIGILGKLKDNIRFYEMIKGSMDDVFLNIVGESINASEAV